MTFANILKSSGIINSDTGSSVSNQNDVDRMIHGYHPNPYSSSNMFPNNLYYPGYNLYNNQGFGLKYGPDYGSNEHSFSEYISDTSHGYSHSPDNNHGHEIYHGGGSPHYSHSHVSEQPRYKSKNSSAMSALTLLAFLFFLNILQSCLKEHMASMNPTVMVMTAGAGRNSIPKIFDSLTFEGKEMNKNLDHVDEAVTDYDDNQDFEIKQKIENFNETLVATPNTITFKTKFKNK